MMSANLLLIILTCATSYYAFNNRAIFEKFKHYPYREYRDKSYARWLTAGFLHGSWMHLLINMFVLYMFGDYVERLLIELYGMIMGPIVYILLYLTVIVLANVPTYLKNKENSSFASIGASGAVSGIVFIYILLNPWQKIYLYGIIGIHGIVAGILYLIYSSWASRKQRDHIDHDAHFYGAVFGVVIMLILEPRLIQVFIKQISDVPFL